MEHESEILSDNTKIGYCRQCRDCVFWDGGDLYSNQYDKASCKMYPFPDHKPMDVMHNRADCPYRIEEGGEK